MTRSVNETNTDEVASQKNLDHLQLLIPCADLVAGLVPHHLIGSQSGCGDIWLLSRLLRLPSLYKPWHCRCEVLSISGKFLRWSDVLLPLYATAEAFRVTRCLSTYTRFVSVFPLLCLVSKVGHLDMIWNFLGKGFRVVTPYRLEGGYHRFRYRNSRDIKFLRNASSQLQDYRTSQPRTPQSTILPPPEHQISDS
jgi:hypothetical protein